MRLTQAALMVGTMLLSIGCGSGQSVYPVEGKIAFSDGKPLVRGAVFFEQLDPPMNSKGLIREDGTFTMKTFGESAGVPEGNYRVAIRDTELFDEEKYSSGDPLVAEKFADPSTSGLTAKVGQNDNFFEFVVEPFSGKTRR